MKKRFVLICSLIFLLLIILVLSIVCGGIFSSNNSLKTPKHVNMDKVRKENFVPGKEAALDWAHVYVDLRGNGSTYTKDEIASELEAWGYTQDEIKYAIKHID